MIESVLLFLGLVILILVTIMISNRLKVAYPILLVLLGLGISFIPSVPKIEINPELIFIAFLPPLLYEAAWANSWKELWKWRRIIGSFAFLVVFITAAAVAVVANWLIPGFSLALGFLLGGIVSPPDAVSAAAILKFVKVPKRIATILEGESLLNDASSLIIFRFAALAVTTGQFIWLDASLSFIWMIVGGAGIGLLIGFILKRIHKYFPTDANMDTILTITTPYLMYIFAEEVHSSGVLSVVCGGLYLSAQRHDMFSATTRVRSINVWHSFVFLLNGLVFTLIGLDLPQIMKGIRQEGISITLATGYAVIITLVLVVTRMLSSFGAVLVTQIMKNFITVADERRPSWKSPTILGWAGMRGVVSLAAALSIPLMSGSEPFPQRNLILYITFVVILLTLIVQGLTLPFLIKKVKLEDFHDHLPERETEELIRRKLAKSSLSFVQTECKGNTEGKHILEHLTRMWDEQLKAEEIHQSEQRREIGLKILDHQREVLLELNKRPEIDETIIRKFNRQLDLEEDKWHDE